MLSPKDGHDLHSFVIDAIINSVDFVGTAAVAIADMVYCWVSERVCRDFVEYLKKSQKVGVRMLGPKSMVAVFVDSS